jgi:hypothetical protein
MWIATPRGVREDGYSPWPQGHLDAQNKVLAIMNY